MSVCMEICICSYKREQKACTYGNTRTSTQKTQANERPLKLIGCSVDILYIYYSVRFALLRLLGGGRLCYALKTAELYIPSFSNFILSSKLCWAALHYKCQRENIILQFS